MNNIFFFNPVVIQIDTYEKIYQEAEQIEGIQIFDYWFRVDAKPFKQALLNIIKRWSFMFKQHLIDHVTNRWVTLECCCVRCQAAYFPGVSVNGCRYCLHRFRSHPMLNFIPAQLHLASTDPLLYT